MNDAGHSMSGKVAVMFGIDDIGRGIARRFAREGAAIALLDSEAGRAVTLAAEMGGRTWASPHGAACDTTIRSAIDTAAREFDGLHVLVINVLPAPTVASLEHQDDGAFNAAFRAVAAARSAMQSGFPYLRATGSGRIVNIGHRYGEGVNEWIGTYNTAAGALVGLTRTAAVDWGRYQIATNLLLPLTDTGEFRAYRGRKPKLLDLMTSQLALGRLGDPVEDIGGAAAFFGERCRHFCQR